MSIARQALAQREVVPRFEVEHRRLADVLDHHEVLLAAGRCALDDVRQRAAGPPPVPGWPPPRPPRPPSPRRPAPCRAPAARAGRPGAALPIDPAEGLLLGPQRVAGGHRGAGGRRRRPAAGRRPPGRRRGRAGRRGPVPGRHEGCAGRSRPERSLAPSATAEHRLGGAGARRPASWTMAVAMDRAEFEELVSEALDLIPVEFTRAMDNVVILVEDRHPTQNLYGLYHGVALTSRTSHYSGHLPDTITIYRTADPGARPRRARPRASRWRRPSSTRSRTTSASTTTGSTSSAGPEPIGQRNRRSDH